MNSGLADLLACVAALDRPFEKVFDPHRFFVEFSARAQPLVPHDGVLIAYLEDEGRTFSVFADNPRPLGPLLDVGNSTTALDRSRRLPRDTGR